MLAANCRCEIFSSLRNSDKRSENLLFIPMIFIQVLNKVIVINYNLHRFNDVKFLFILRSVLPASKRRILPSDPPVPNGGITGHTSCSSASGGDGSG